MRKFILALTIIIVIGCNTKKSTDSNHDSVSYNANEDNSTNNDLPASIYFKVVKINTSQYIGDGVFEMDFDLLNNTDYKFSSVNFSGDIYVKMKNSENICDSPVQHDDWKPYSDDNYGNHILNWEPHTIKHIYFLSRAYCINTYDRTPEEITLIIKIRKAISIDAEVEGAFAKYDLLDLWKERQVKEGLR